ncbi:HXXEE domain-containing protein [uncultured Amaricoccus sp.]|uniref:HXXEE domain-containing protein n=1 Tax=uncultured Amaricoccus sp. TaxID=339341 RepID=UPI00262C3DB8|nr:HXXEE domain-containing protein [uncultured Amaricoccus sp.]
MKDTAIDWLAGRWVACALFMACALLLFAPVVFVGLTPALFLLFLHSPAYMLHQAEEHTHDRFRRFANHYLFHGLDGLTTRAVLVINLPIVWGLNLGAFCAGWLLGAGWGLAAPYCLVVNALAHVGASARLRVYDPGLVTSILIFLPLGLLTIATIAALPGVGFAAHATGLGIALGIHVAIVVSTLRHFRELGRPGAATAPAE